MKYYIFFNGLIIIFGICGFHGKAMAHRVTIFAWLDGDTVHTQSRFSGGKAVQNGHISVYDREGKLLLTGKTDSAGELDFKLPETDDLRITLDAGMGHVGEWMLSAEDADHSLRKGNEPKQKVPLSSPNSKAVLKESPGPTSSLHAGLTREEIKAIIDESIDNKLKPMMKLLIELNDKKPSFSDILSGIGYILGLVGLGAYIHYRKKR